MDYPNIHLLNFRDLGGLKTKDGKVLKCGYIFRSAQPGLNIDQESIDGIESLGLNTIFDLRDPSTILGRVDYKFRNINNVNISVLDSIDKKYRHGEFDFAAIDVAMWDYKDPTFKDFRNKYKEYLKLYTEIPFSKDFSKIFSALDRHEKILLHCQGGKDRTGIFFVILLTALNVNKKEILNDYLLSNVYRKKKNKWRIKNSYQKSHKLYCAYYMKKLVVLERRYYNLILKTINHYYGSFDNYLVNHFGVTKERLADWKSYYFE